MPPPRAPTKTIGGAPPQSIQTNSGAAVPTSRFTLTEILDRLLEVMPTTFGAHSLGSLLRHALLPDRDLAGGDTSRRVVPHAYIAAPGSQSLSQRMHFNVK
jgi:hypothetical protein